MEQQYTQDQQNMAKKIKGACLVCKWQNKRQSNSQNHYCVLTNNPITNLYSTCDDFHQEKE